MAESHWLPLQRTPVPGGSNALSGLCVHCMQGVHRLHAAERPHINFKSNHKRTFVSEIACGCGLSLEDEVGGLLEPGV